MNTQTETIKVKTTTNKPEKKYIYMCSWFETKRHRISYTNMYFEKAEDTNWIFDTPDWFLELVRIEYICVMSNTREYSMAQISKYPVASMNTQTEINQKIPTCSLCSKTAPLKDGMCLICNVKTEQQKEKEYYEKNKDYYDEYGFCNSCGWCSAYPNSHTDYGNNNCEFINKK